MRPARTKLRDAETEYLLANGWKPDPHQRGAWITPNPAYPERSYGHGHAVNSQKYHEDQIGDDDKPVYPPKYAPSGGPLSRSHPRVVSKKLPHPICMAMAEHRPDLAEEPQHDPAEQLAHLERSVRHHMKNRHKYGASSRKDIRQLIRYIRVGWKPRVGRGMPPLPGSTY